MRISGLLAVKQILMISSCPPSYPDRQTASRCSRENTEDYNYLTDIPVTSLNTGHVYRCYQNNLQVFQKLQKYVIPGRPGTFSVPSATVTERILPDRKYQCDVTV